MTLNVWALPQDPYLKILELGFKGIQGNWCFTQRKAIHWAS